MKILSINEYSVLETYYHGVYSEELESEVKTAQDNIEREYNVEVDTKKLNGKIYLQFKTNKTISSTKIGITLKKGKLPKNIKIDD